MLLSGFLLVCLLYTLYFNDTHTIFYRNVSSYYGKLKALNALVGSQYSNIFKILWVMILLICKTLYLHAWQKFNKSIRRIDKNTYEVSYVINGILYRMVVKPKKGPKSIIEAVDENDDDMTHVLISYLGPMENFHGISLSPSFFGKEKITVNLTTGEEVSFNSNETIVLNTS